MNARVASKLLAKAIVNNSCRQSNPNIVSLNDSILLDKRYINSACGNGNIYDAFNRVINEVQRYTAKNTASSYKRDIGIIYKNYDTAMKYHTAEQTVVSMFKYHYPQYNYPYRETGLVWAWVNSTF